MKHLRKTCKWKKMWCVAISASRSLRRILTKFAPPPAFIKFVATDDEKVIGTTVLRIDPRNNGHINEMHVTDAYRNNGIGTALVKHAIEAARAEKIDKIMLGTEINNRPAIRVYEKCGFRIVGESVNMELDLRGDER